MKLSLSFTPREDRFFFLLHQSTVNIQKVAGLFQALMEDFENVEAKVSEIKEFEEFGDQIIHNITQLLHRTFVTPLDREDILGLAGSLDDVIDAIDEAAQYMLEYRIVQPTEYARHLATIVRSCADELERAVALLSARGSKLKDILPIAVEINRLENEADRVLGRAMGELFNDPGNIIDILKWRDIYQNMEEATDRAEDAADVLEGIVLKHS